MIIQKLEINNFKSIERVVLECRRINVFIGKPNTGKSNLLESLGIFSVCYNSNHFPEGLVRYDSLPDLFFDRNFTQAIEVSVNDTPFPSESAQPTPRHEVEKKGWVYKISFQDNSFMGKGYISYTTHGYAAYVGTFEFSLDSTGRGSLKVFQPSPIRFYRFKPLKEFPGPVVDYLLPPHGDNLLQVLQTYRELRQDVARLLHEYDLRIVIDLEDWKLRIQRQFDDIIVWYPYSVLSDTLQRLIFYLAAIETNRNAVLLLEEPESHAFPFYTKYLGERIALDKSNQYFISTHNPYLLFPLVEKTPRDEIQVFVTSMENHRTQVRPISEKAMQDLLDLDVDVFFELDRLLGAR